MARTKIRVKPTAAAPRTPKRSARGPGRRRRERPAGAPTDDDTRVLLRVSRDDQVVLQPRDPREIQEAAMRWSYVLRNRRRWSDRASARASHARSSEEQLRASLGVEPDFLRRVAEAGTVEVDVPYRDEEDGWEYRVYPWEYVLASATRDARRGRALTVVRRLRLPAPSSRRAVTPLLHLETAPGRLRTEYSFTSERDLVASGFGVGPATRIEDPLRSELEAAVAGLDPGVVHVSGFDSHEGLELLGIEDEGGFADGLLLRGPRGPEADYGVEAVPAEELARILTAGRHKPLLVGFNVFNSAPRCAPLCVAGGAESAVGFQDTFDDPLAELFFSSFYQAWRLSGWATSEAFRFAWEVVRDQGRDLQGSGVVLWSRRSLFDAPAAVEGQAAGAPAQASSVGEIESRLREEAQKSAIVLGPDNVTRHIRVEAVPVSLLNYSILHNNGRVFEQFKIWKEGYVGPVEGLEIAVELHVGTESFPFRMKASLDEKEPGTDLKDGIRVSLASSLSRSVRESVHTSLFVEVSWRGTVLERVTHRVTLLPIDEWKDDDANRVWLPSFVLPRDPAVPKVVDSAQRYLMALLDDPTAGFDGYQNADGGPGLTADPATACEVVDRQVQALWCALLFELPLAYINPPPTFTAASQRLRSPSEVIQGRRGTCIDLALLLAACLEYVEIYPAIVVLRDHAFPAYWRHHAFHEEFSDLTSAPAPVATGSPPAAQPSQKHRWYFEQAHFREIVQQVGRGRLVPLETVSLTRREGFWTAVEEGQKNLASRSHFHSMLDITLARTSTTSPVTPLPVQPLAP